MRPIKCVIVGDGAVGKSCLLASFATNEFPSEYYVPLFSDYWDAPVTVMTGGEQYPLTLVDTAGQEDYVNVRPLYYPQTDVFLVAFSVVLPSSFENVIEKWIPEIQRYCPNTPFILVGTKSDLRNDPGTLHNLAKNMQRPVTPEDGDKLAKALKAFQCVECSALTRKGLRNVFEQASLAALEPTRTKDACVIF